MVVDDDASIHSLVTDLLQEKGYRVRAAASADAAIAFLQDAHVDAIVLDVKMPGRSGLDVLEHVRLHPKLRNVPVLILTGANFTADEETIVSTHRAYVFYKQENLEEFALYIDRLTIHRLV